MPDGMWEDMLLRLPSMLPLILSAAPQLATDLHAQPPVRAPPLKLQSISQSRRSDVKALHAVSFPTKQTGQTINLMLVLMQLCCPVPHYGAHQSLCFSETHTVCHIFCAR